MARHYSNPKRSNDPHALPNVETFFHQHGKRELCMLNAGHVAERFGECIVDDEGNCSGTGWYYWFCLPGCMPDGEPSGPFETEALALADAREGCDDDFDETDLALGEEGDADGN